MLDNPVCEYCEDEVTKDEIACSLGQGHNILFEGCLASDDPLENNEWVFTVAFDSPVWNSLSPAQRRIWLNDLEDKIQSEVYISNIIQK